MHNQRRHILCVPKGRRQSRQPALALNHLVRFILEIAHSIPSRLPDANSRNAEITTALVGELAPDSTGLADPAVDDWFLGRGDIAADAAAEVVGYKITGGLVDVESVRYIVAVEREGSAIGDNYRISLIFFRYSGIRTS